jgi:hypothetical protein
MTSIPRTKRRPMGVTPRKKGEILSTYLSALDIIHMETEIDAFCVLQGLATCNQLDANPIKQQLRGFEGRSLDQYRLYWLELGRFAYLIGDIQTATICSDRKRPKDPLPAEPRTIALFYKYKSTETVAAITDFERKSVQYVNGHTKKNNSPLKGKIVMGMCVSVPTGSEKKGLWLEFECQC